MHHLSRLVSFWKLNNGITANVVRVARVNAHVFRAIGGSVRRGFAARGSRSQSTGRHGSTAAQGTRNITDLVADFALAGIDVGSQSCESNFVIREMTFIASAGTGSWDNIAVVRGTTLVVGVVVVGGRHDDDDDGGGWFGLNCEKSIRLYIEQGSFYHPLNDIAMTSGVKIQSHILSSCNDSYRLVINNPLRDPKVCF
jgi:hypothetical protein